MDALLEKYFPLTSIPGRCNSAYSEIPSKGELRQYVRCFWGTDAQKKDDSTDRSNTTLVIPDTCMDIIYSTDSKGVITSGLCTVDKSAYLVTMPREVRIFAIRFYAWSAVLFADSPFWDVSESYYDTDELFKNLNRELLPLLAVGMSLAERSAAVSKILLKRLDEGRMNSILMNAVYDIISSKGAVKMKELVGKNAVSARQLERIFNGNMGVSPKSFTSLVRYQMLWQELYLKGGNIMDMVEEYGYCDQAHLINDFRRRHSMTPREALKFAFKG